MRIIIRIARFPRLSPTLTQSPRHSLAQRDNHVHRAHEDAAPALDARRVVDGRYAALERDAAFDGTAIFAPATGDAVRFDFEVWHRFRHG